jgi:hypothetical protein
MLATQMRFASSVATTQTVHVNRVVHVCCGRRDSDLVLSALCTEHAPTIRCRYVQSAQLQELVLSFPSNVVRAPAQDVLVSMDLMGAQDLDLEETLDFLARLFSSTDSHAAHEALQVVVCAYFLSLKPASEQYRCA